MSNRIIVPANYSIKVVIELDPRTGQTQLLINNRSNHPLSTLQVAGLLAEHNASLMKSIITNTVKLEPETPETNNSKPNGGDNHAT